MAADEMFQLEVNLVEFAAEFANDLEEFVIQLAGGLLGSCHVEQMARPYLKNLADDAFGEDSELARHPKWGDDRCVKTVSYRTVKQQEARRRLASAHQARSSARSAKLVQSRVSMVGSGSKWRITNLRQVARAMAAWA
jgi:hypothetical protein